MAARNFPCWLTAFMEYTNDTPSTPIFRLWSGISALAGAIERRAFLIISGKRAYPNLYVLLVGHPGSGKSMAIGETEELWRELGTGGGGPWIAPTSVTFKGLLIEMSKLEKHLVTSTETITIPIHARPQSGVRQPHAVQRHDPDGCFE